MTRRKLIIDCDPGQDDAIGILLALGSPDEIDLLGICAVAGNAPLRHTTRNARKVCELAGRPDVPVYAGCPRPMVRPLHTAELVHGPTGLDGADLPEPTMPLQERHAVEFLIETCRAAEDGEITLCTMGPMTDLGVALVMAPDIASKFREIVFMGGVARQPGNTIETTEFNISTDPHAAQLALHCGAPVVMMGLDVTYKALTTPERLERFRAIGTPVGDAAAGWLAYYDKFDIERYGMPGGPLHDPCTVAYVLRPELFQGKRVNVEVELSSALTMGQTVADWWRMSDRPLNCQVMTDIYSDGFYDLLIERLGRLPLS